MAWWSGYTWRNWEKMGYHSPLKDYRCLQKGVQHLSVEPDELPLHFALLGRAVFWVIDICIKFIHKCHINVFLRQSGELPMPVPPPKTCHTVCKPTPCSSPEKCFRDECYSDIDAKPPPMWIWWSPIWVPPPEVYWWKLDVSWRPSAKRKTTRTGKKKINSEM